MSRGQLRKLVTLAASLLLAATAVWLQRDEAARPTETGGWAPEAASPASSSLWTELPGAVLAEDPGNDGDSFAIAHREGRNVLRLYFVDCPEKRRHQFNRGRLADQGAAFGGLTEADTLRIGREARDFTLQLLRQRPFRVFTRWEPVYDERRHYAHLTIKLPDGRERSLAELLVEAGLARIHTKGVDLPSGEKRAAFQHHLRALEKSARLSGRGGWAQFAEANAAQAQ